jgi:catechol 2,3-dioxygenase-like lactoylglutathione lyase family enzyme
MEFGQLHHVEYYVADLELSNKFWSWFLASMGYSEYQKWNEGISFAHPNGTYLVFVQVLPEYLDIVNNRQASGLNHIAFKGGSVNFLNDLNVKLLSSGIHIQTRDDHHICFIDPNNFAVEVFI